jgi:hypothetical protein
MQRAWPPAPDAAPEVLAAWHGAWGYVDYFRKVILADCRLAARGKAALEERKMTNDQIDDEAHTSDEYVAYLTAALSGRVAYEKAIREQVGA